MRGLIEYYHDDFGTGDGDTIVEMRGKLRTWMKASFYGEPESEGEEKNIDDGSRKKRKRSDEAEEEDAVLSSRPTRKVKQML